MSGEVQETPTEAEIKLAEFEFGREQTDRNAQLQHELSNFRALFLMNGIGASVVIGLFQATLFEDEHRVYYHLLLIGASMIFVLGAIFAQSGAHFRERSRQKFMYAHEASASRLMKISYRKDSYSDPIEGYNKEGWKYLKSSRWRDNVSSFCFFLGIIVVISWSLLNFLQPKGVFLFQSMIESTSSEGEDIRDTGLRHDRKPPTLPTTRVKDATFQDDAKSPETRRHLLLRPQPFQP